MKYTWISMNFIPSEKCKKKTYQTTTKPQINKPKNLNQTKSIKQKITTKNQETNQPVKLGKKKPKQKNRFQMLNLFTKNQSFYFQNAHLY